MKTFGFAVASAVLFAAPVLAQSTDREVMEAMSRCSSITDAAQRVACYDAAAPRLKTQLGTQPATPRPVITRAEETSWFGFKMPDLFSGSTETQTTPQQFGSNNLTSQQRASLQGNANATAQAPIDSITATITEYAQNPRGNYVMFLDNGQVWRQQEGDGGVMQFKRNQPNVVRISRGFWDSYNLKLNTGSALFKVVRVK